MNVNDLKNRVTVACLHYQGEVSNTGDFSASELQEIKQSAFPQSVPVDFRTQPGFHGLAIFPLEKRIAVSYIFDGGATDDWKRPILSAKVIAIETAVWNTIARDISPIIQFLTTNDCGSKTPVNLHEPLAELIESESALFSQETFAEVFYLVPFALPRLAHLIHACVFSRNIILYTGQSELREKVLRCLLFWLPLHQIGHLHISTVCADVSTMNRENLVFASGQPVVDWKQKLKSMLGSKKLTPDDCCAIDLQSPEFPEVRARAMQPAEIERILRELLEGSAWKPLTFRQKYQLLLAYLERMSGGKHVKWQTLADEFGLVDKKGREQFKQFIEKLKEK